MPIGGVKSGSWYSIGGKPLGVQIGQKGASDLFGGATAQSLFAAPVIATANSSIQVDPQQLVIKGIQDEIDRTLGYRTNLSVAEKQKLADYQSEIARFDQLAQTRTLTEDENKDRGEAYVNAYRLLGKDFVDVAADEFLKGKTEELQELMKRKPKGAEAKRLEVLEKLKQNMLDRVNDANNASTSEIYYLPLRNVQRQIAKLTEPREITELSPEEIRQHDEIANAINDYAGQELQILSDKRLKIARLQATMRAIQESGGGGVNILA